ncbi:hypothetical protein GCM10022395_01870 [Snuella lapsa]|uniref:Uncharacterized protein n=2 Tax=Snuella lapsa TaxID=870481 RepID=A0ABP6WQJ8_9FLAO
MYGIQANFNRNTELSKLEQSLWLDFNRYSKITYDALEDKLTFTTAIDTTSYTFTERGIVKALDTFNIRLQGKTMFFDGNSVGNGTIDALKLKTSKNFQQQELLVFKKNDATLFMN